MIVSLYPDRHYRWLMHPSQIVERKVCIPLGCKSMCFSKTFQIQEGKPAAGLDFYWVRTMKNPHNDSRFRRWRTEFISKKRAERCRSATKIPFLANDTFLSNRLERYMLNVPEMRSPGVLPQPWS